MREDLEAARALIIRAGILVSAHIPPEPAPNLNGGLRWCLEEAGRQLELLKGVQN